MHLYFNCCSLVTPKKADIYLLLKISLSLQDVILKALQVPSLHQISFPREFLPVLELLKLIRKYMNWENGLPHYNISNVTSNRSAGETFKGSPYAFGSLRVFCVLSHDARMTALNSLSSLKHRYFVHLYSASRKTYKIDFTIKQYLLI